MLKKLVPLFILIAMVSGSVTAFAGDAWYNTTAPSKSNINQVASTKLDIVGTALNNSNFSTLVTALKAAGLVDTLKMNGPYTVFAPTNAAFAKLPTGTLESLLNPENKNMLQ